MALTPRFCVGPMGAATLALVGGAGRLVPSGEERTWQHIWSFSCVCPNSFLKYQCMISFLTLKITYDVYSM